MPAALTLKNISKNFNENTAKPLAVLRHINLEIMTGEIFVFLGPSGCGKSTLLRIMSGLDQIYQGSLIHGASTQDKNLHMGFVFQQFALLPWLTIFQNVELPLVSQSLTTGERHQRVFQELERLGLEAFAGSRPHELSGGMRQRAGIARALVNQPNILLMDEPFSELDSFTAAELRLELLKIWREQHLTIVLVTHITEEAIELGDHIAVLTSRPSHVEKLISNPLPRPRHTRSPAFFQLQDELQELVRH
jgi:ABC-type nitrate/sulfonate/bicarbonate transport system ATPase subunit